MFEGILKKPVVLKIGEKITGTPTLVKNRKKESQGGPFRKKLKKMSKRAGRERLFILIEV